MERTIKIYTGTGGYDLISEMFEKEGLGTYRLYAPKKLLRIAKSMFPHKSASGRIFKRLKIQINVYQIEK